MQKLSCVPDIQKTPPRPIVDLPFTTKFKECVAIDQKFYKGNTFLILPSNKPDQIVNSIMKYWVAVYGTVDTFLTENGGEFVNEEFMLLCEALNIKVHTTGAESSW